MVVQSKLEPMTLRVPKASSRTKSVSHTGHDINPTHVYHALESLRLFKSSAGRSISQADVRTEVVFPHHDASFLSNNITSLPRGGSGVVVDFLSSHLLGEAEVGQWRNVITRYTFSFRCGLIKI